MESQACAFCKSKARLSCGVCASALCRTCAQFLEKNSFHLLEPNIPANLTHETYCGKCFIEHVAPALNEYETTLENARSLLVFTRSRGDETRVVRSSEKKISVADCADEKETLLKLAFVASKKKFNALLDVEFSSRKIRNGGYQTSLWNGSGIPARVDASKFPVPDRRVD